MDPSKSLSFYIQGFEQAENCITRVYVLTYDTIIKSGGRLIGMVNQHLGKSKILKLLNIRERKLFSSCCLFTLLLLEQG